MFQRHQGHYVATFVAYEVRVLRKVASEVVGLLTKEFDHRDPVVGRLFPDVYPGDPENSADFRRYTEGDLKTAKIDQAGAVLAALPPVSGGEVRLDGEAAEAWLRALNDARLALGVRLEITDDTDVYDELDEAVLRDPTSTRVFQLWAYDYLGLLQDSLLMALVDDPDGN